MEHVWKGFAYFAREKPGQDIKMSWWNRRGERCGSRCRIVQSHPVLEKLQIITVILNSARNTGGKF